MRVQLVIMPDLSLNVLQGLITQQALGRFDASYQNKVEKYVKVLDDVMEYDDLGYRHLFYGFYFEIPVQIAFEFREFQHYSHFRETASLKGFAFKGILTAPLDLWREFFVWGTHEDRTDPMKALMGFLYQHLKEIPYFRILKLQSDGKLCLPNV